MTPIFPIIELVDRYAIAKLKFDKTQANQEELDFYSNQLSQYDLNIVNSELDALYDIHSKIWNLESLLKSGREQELSLEEIGRRAIAIRDLNHQRIELKNSIAGILGCRVREVKKDHLSE
jgi:hypothetical protein